MRVLCTADSLPEDRLGQLAVYNSMDCLSLFEIMEGLNQELTGNRRKVYEFELELQAALLDMELAGLPVDLPRRQLLTQQTEHEKAQIDAILHRLCDAIGYYDWYRRLACQRYADATGEALEELPSSWDDWLSRPLNRRKEWKSKAGQEKTTKFQKALKESEEPFNANSSTQKLRLFYHFFGSPDNAICREEFPDWPPPWNKTRGITEYKTRGTNGEYSPSTDREALERIAAKDSTPDDAAYWAQPFVSCCLALADLNKTLGFLKCRLEAGTFRYSFGSVTDTGRLNSKKNAQGFGWNAQNVTPKLRIMFTAPLGHKLAATDYAQIESRCVAARCFTQFGATNYISACECGDAHTLICSMVYPEFDWPADFTMTQLLKHGPFPKDMLRAAKKISNQEFYRGKSYRDASKTLGHGSNYCGKPPQMSKHSHIPVKHIEAYQDVYFSMFPEIRQWHHWIVEQLQTAGEITTLMGRTRQFFDRPSDDSTVRAATAFDPQSMAADYCNTALMRLLRATIDGSLLAQLRVQKHDEIILTFEEENQPIVVPRMVELMEHRLTLTAPDGTTREWYVPAEAEVGWNLGRRIDYVDGVKLEVPINPDGLLAYPDDRQRAENPFSLLGVL
jgi:hypothetical protein